jgi:hypothetical protein
VTAGKRIPQSGNGRFDDCGTGGPVRTPKSPDSAGFYVVSPPLSSDPSRIYNISDIFTCRTHHGENEMAVDDTSDDPVRAERPADDETDASADRTDAGPAGGPDEHPRVGRPGDDRRPSPAALGATESELTIAFGRETGEIRIERETALGTFTERVER